MKKINVSTAAMFLACPLVVISHFAFSAPDVEGRVMVDKSFYDGAHNNHEAGSEWQVRRARIGVEHEEGDWEASLEADFDNEANEVDVKNAKFTYVGWSFAEITLGKMKESFGLENKTSSLHISTMERSIVSDVFAPGRNMGVEVARGTQTHSLTVGAFNSSEDEYGLDGYALTGRATLSPINREGAIVHLGISATARDMQGESYEVNKAMEVNTADKIIETSEIEADSVETISLEGALVYKQFSLQSEWMGQNVSPVMSQDFGGDLEFNGYYLLASYFLTGESRVYDEGKFKRPDSARPGGAWELVARYSDIDLMDVAQGTSATSVLLGVNWYATEHMRAMMSASRIDVDGSDSEESGTGDSLSFRLQYEF